MPMKCDDAPECVECFGFCWATQNEELLAKYVAYLLAGQAAFITKIVARGTPARAKLSKAALREFQKALQTPKKDELRWIRDGWLFQMISWVAVKMQAPAAVLRAPQPQSSAKGIDTLYIEFEGKSQRPRLTIGEDKATKHPRATIRDDVWPEFEAFERGDRDPELISEISALLAHTKSPQRAVDSALWKSERRYRVAITTVHGRTDNERARLFKGYRKRIPGPRNRRRADTFHVDLLRTWMDAFAKKVVANLKQMKVY